MVLQWTAKVDTSTNFYLYQARPHIVFHVVYRNNHSLFPVTDDLMLRIKGWKKKETATPLQYTPHYFKEY